MSVWHQMHQSSVKGEIKRDIMSCNVTVVVFTWRLGNFIVANSHVEGNKPFSCFREKDYINVINP